MKRSKKRIIAILLICSLMASSSAFNVFAEERKSENISVSKNEDIAVTDEPANETPVISENTAEAAEPISDNTIINETVSASQIPSNLATSQIEYEGLTFKTSEDVNISIQTETIPSDEFDNFLGKDVKPEIQAVVSFDIKNADGTPADSASIEVSGFSFSDKVVRQETFTCRGDEFTGVVNESDDENIAKITVENGVTYIFAGLYHVDYNNGLNLDITDEMPEEPASGNVDTEEAAGKVDLDNIKPVTESKWPVNAENEIDLNDFPDIRDQGSDGLCWAFSAVAALEMPLVKSGYANVKDIDISELAVAYELRQLEEPRMSVYEFFNRGNNPTDVFTGQDFRIVYHGDTGEVEVTQDLKAHDECDLPYEKIKELEKDQSWVNLGNPDFNVNEKIETSNKEQVKWLIKNYGAVTELYHDDTVKYYDYAHNSYYTPSNVDVNTSHAVAIVGWDDTFPKENFKTTPAGDGAWLIRNSWGYDGYGKSGYFWMSYYDKYANFMCATYDASPITEDDDQPVYKIAIKPQNAENNADNYRSTVSYVVDQGDTIWVPFKLYGRKNLSSSITVTNSDPEKVTCKSTIPIMNQSIKLEIPEDVKAGTATITLANGNGKASIKVYVREQGQCGERLYYTYDPFTRALKVTGKGRTYDYGNGSPYGKTFPYCLDAYTVELPDGIENIKATFSKITSLYLPGTLKDINIVVKSGVCKKFKVVKNTYADEWLSSMQDASNFEIERVYIPATDITIVQSPWHLPMHRKSKLAVETLPLSNSEQKPVWTSSDPDIATVSQDGTIKGISEGTVTITATAHNGLSDSVEVVVTGTPGIILKEEEKTITKKDTFTIETDYLESTETGITWSSDDDTIATVTSAGLVTGTKKGETIIRGTTVPNGYVAECYLTVEPLLTTELVEVYTNDAQIENVKNSTTYELYVGNSYQFNVLTDPEDTDTDNVTWTSYNPSIATVDDKGVVTAVSQGSCSIEASIPHEGWYQNTQTVSRYIKVKDENPAPITIPDPDPNPNPDPKPNPDPNPDPKPNPDPTPNPNPTPDPAPAPETPENPETPSSNQINRKGTVTAGEKIDIVDQYIPEAKELNGYQVKYEVRTESGENGTKYASVTNKGILTAKKAGTVIVLPTVKIGGKTYRTKISATIKIAPAPKLKFTKQLTYTGQQVNVYDFINKEWTEQGLKAYGFSSNKENVATIDKSGIITAGEKGGSARITVFFNNKGENGAVNTLKRTANITVKVPMFAKTEYKLQTGQIFNLPIRNVPKTTDVAWSVSGDNVSLENTNINSRIKLTGLKAGEAQLNAQIDGKVYTCRISVIRPEMKKTAVTVKVGKKATVGLKKTRIKPGDVKWISEDPSIATVDYGGKVTGVAAGTTVVYTEAGGVRNECSVTVE